LLLAVVLQIRLEWWGLSANPTIGGGEFEVLWLLNYAGLLIFGTRPQSMLVCGVGEWAVWSVAGW